MQLKEENCFNVIKKKIKLVISQDKSINWFKLNVSILPVTCLRIQD